MANFIYNLLIALLMPFFVVWWVASLLTPKYRVGWKERLGFLPLNFVLSLNNHSVFWIHTVSVGEVNAAVPLVIRLKENFPNKKIIVSTVTVTGHHNVISKLDKIDGLFYFPFDFPWIVKRVVNQLHPELFIFFETEIWPNLLRHLRQRNIPSVLVNGRISDRSFNRYSKIKLLMKYWLDTITLALMQTDEDRKKFLSLGGNPDRTVTTGNTKYDQIRRPDHVPFRGIPIFAQWEWWVAGSTHFDEEELIIQAFLSLKEEFPHLGLLLAPRHPERWEEVAALLEKFKVPFLKRTDLQVDTTWNENCSPVILLNTMGELSDCYYWATIAFIGGSLVPRGGHNILEAAMWGKAPLFGPYSDNFREMTRIFKDKNAGIEISSREEIVSKITYCLRNRTILEQMGKRAEAIFRENQGVTERNLGFIASLMR